jgi:hypothetical protein
MMNRFKVPFYASARGKTTGKWRQVTKPAHASGALVFTNLPNTDTNNFWRIRSGP